MEGDKKPAFAILQAMCITVLALPFIPLPNQNPIFQKANQIH
jgi:hypothetical protein